MNIFGITDKRWTHANEITNFPRTLKMRVREFNNAFGTDDEHKYYILSGSYGYRLTNDRKEIFEAIEREERITKIRWKQAHTRRKAAQEYFNRNERLPL